MQDILSNMMTQLEEEKKKLLEEETAADTKQESIAEQEEPESELEADDEDVQLDAPEKYAEEDEEDEAAPKESAAWRKMRQKLKEEKNQRKELEKLLAEMRGRQQAIEEMYKGTKQPEPEPVEQDSEPDKDYDPDGWRDWKIRQLENQVQQTNVMTKQQYELRGVEILENECRSKRPDYDKAFEFIRSQEEKLLKIRYPNVSERDISDALQQKKLEFFREMANQGQNAAEVIIRLAEAQGYAPAQAKEAPAAKATPNLDVIERNMKRNASFVGGTAKPVAEKTSEDYALKTSIMDLVANPNYIIEAEKKARRKLGLD